MFILDPNSYARDPAGMAQKIQSVTESVGVKILASRLWNEQRLAYAIDGHRKGVYWLIYFELESTSIPKYTRACQLIDQVLRFLTVRIPPRLVDAMVSAAKGERPKAGGGDAASEDGAPAEQVDQAVVGT
jgi:small subunit ribosomal protein S6